MYRNLLTILLIITLLLVFLQNSMIAGAKPLKPIKYQFRLKLKEGIDHKKYINALNRILKSDASPIKSKEGNLYLLSLTLRQDKTKEYNFLFNSLPAITMVNGKKAVPRSEIISKKEFPSTRTTPEHVKGEILVKLKKNAPTGIIDDINLVFETSTIGYNKNLDIYHLKAPRGRTAITYSKMLMLSPYVGYAELNLKYKAF